MCFIFCSRANESHKEKNRKREREKDSESITTVAFNVLQSTITMHRMIPSGRDVTTNE